MKIRFQWFQIVQCIDVSVMPMSKIDNRDQLRLEGKYFDQKSECKTEVKVLEKAASETGNFSSLKNVYPPEIFLSISKV